MKVEKNIYYKNGLKYRKLKRNEVIKKGALHSWCLGELMPIVSDDTVGDTPSSFSDERDFYNPVED